MNSFAFWLSSWVVHPKSPIVNLYSKHSIRTDTINSSPQSPVTSPINRPSWHVSPSCCPSWQPSPPSWPTPPTDPATPNSGAALFPLPSSSLSQRTWLPKKQPRNPRSEASRLLLPMELSQLLPRSPSMCISTSLQDRQLPAAGM